MLTGEMSAKQALEEARKLGATHYQRRHTCTSGVFGGNWELSSLHFFNLDQACPVEGCKMEVAVWLSGLNTFQLGSRPSGFLVPQNTDHSDSNAMAIGSLLEIDSNFIAH